MTNQDGLILVFTGSSLDANFIKSILTDNSISCLIRDTLKESLSAGWASGAPEDSNLVYVEKQHQQFAKELIEQYLSSLNSQ